MVELREQDLARPMQPGEHEDYPDPYAGDLDQEQEPEAYRSLIGDIEALIDDGRTYLDAELSYQKTRASFVSDRLKKALVFGVAAGLLGFVALIGLTVGLIIALTPLITGWGATAVVVGLELLVVVILLKRAARNWSGVTRAMKKDDPNATTPVGEA